MQRIESKQFKKFFSNNKLLINCGILAILFLVNCLLPVFAWASFIVLGIMIIINTIEDGFSLIVACIPFCCLYEYTSVILFFSCVVLFIVKNYIVAVFKDKLKIDKTIIICTIILFLYMIFTARLFDLILLAKLFILFAILLLLNLFILYPKASRIKFNLCLLSLMFFVSVTYCMFYYPLVKDTHYFFYVGDFIRFEALLVNPNTLAMICEICVACLAYYFISGKSDVMCTIAFVIFTALGVSSFSKTFLILLAIICMILFVYAIIKSPIKSIIWFVCIVGVVALALILKGDFFKTYLERFINSNTENMDSEEIISMITTSRSDLWLTYVQYLIDNPSALIFGRGFNAPRIYFSSPHNMYISMLYELGVVGTIIFVVLIFFVLKKLFINEHHKVTKGIIIPLSVIMLLMCVEDLIFFLY